MSFYKKINLRRVSIAINVKMNRAPTVMSVGPNGPRAPTTVSVGPVRSQHGSGVRKRKYKRRSSGKRKRKVGKKHKTNVRGKGIDINSLLRSILKV